MLVHEIVGLGVALLVLAGLSMVVVNGGNSSQVLGTGANGAVNLVRAATLR